MKSFYFVLILLFLIGCKEEKTFADDIVLSFPKDTKVKTQEFNEDSNEGGENLLYIGKVKSNIEVKYYKNIISEPPPPPKEFESKNDYLIRIKKLNDSLSLIKNKYFRNDEIKILETKESFIDSLSNKNLEIIVKENDIIPLYKQDFYTNAIKKYSAFPIFIKNISNEVLKIPTTINSNPFLYIFDSKAKAFFFTKNYSYWFCGTGTDYNSYFELKPNEILVYAYPYFKSGIKQKAKVKFYNVSSKEFEISIEDKIIQSQRNRRYE